MNLLLFGPMKFRFYFGFVVSFDTDSVPFHLNCIKETHSTSVCNCVETPKTKQSIEVCAVLYNKSYTIIIVVVAELLSCCCCCNPLFLFFLSLLRLLALARAQHDFLLSGARTKCVNKIVCCAESVAGWWIFFFFLSSVDSSAEVMTYACVTTLWPALEMNNIIYERLLLLLRLLNHSVLIIRSKFVRVASVWECVYHVNRIEFGVMWVASCIVTMYLWCDALFTDYIRNELYTHTLRLTHSISLFFYSLLPPLTHFKPIRHPFGIESVCFCIRMNRNNTLTYGTLIESYAHRTPHTADVTDAIGMTWRWENANSKFQTLIYILFSTLLPFHWLEISSLALAGVRMCSRAHTHSTCIHRQNAFALN